MHRLSLPPVQQILPRGRFVLPRLGFHLLYSAIPATSSFHGAPCAESWAERERRGRVLNCLTTALSYGAPRVFRRKRPDALKPALREFEQSLGGSDFACCEVRPLTTVTPSISSAPLPVPLTADGLHHMTSALTRLRLLLHPFLLCPCPTKREGGRED